MNALCSLTRTARSLAVALLLTGCAAVTFGQAPPLAPAKDDKAKTEGKTPPESPEIQARRAFLDNKFDDAAYKHLQEAVKANPELGTPEVVLSRWLAEAKKPQEARTMLERAAILNGDHPEVYLLNAVYALGDNRVSEAILDLQQVQTLAMGPWPAKQRNRFQKEADNGLAAAYERRNNWGKARQYLQSLKDADPTNPQVLQRLARANFLLGDDAEAANNLRAAFMLDKTLDPPELTLAQQWANKWAISQDDKDRAKTDEWYKKALQEYNAPNAMASTDPLVKERAAKVYRGFANWQLDQGNLQVAKDQLDTIKKLDPNSADTKITEGLYYRHLKKPVEAANAFDDALRINPNNAIAFANLAPALADADRPGDRTRALSYAELYKNQNAQNPDAYAVLGYCYLKQGKIDDADQALTIALRAGQITPDTGYFIALLLTKRDKWKQAEELLKKILDQKRPFIYKTEAKDLLATVEKKLPPPPPKK